MVANDLVTKQLRKPSTDDGEYARSAARGSEDDSEGCDGDKGDHDTSRDGSVSIIEDVYGSG